MWSSSGRRPGMTRISVRVGPVRPGRIRVARGEERPGQRQRRLGALTAREPLGVLTQC